ncbi:MAG: carboxypeptidase-like regulatory domain-containing protein [Chryseolinea sp.]
MKRGGLFFLTFLVSIAGIAQSTSSLSGTVIDVKTNEPVPFASVFLANTMLGASTKEDGTFLIEKIPVGKYDVTVSMVGYKLFSASISFSDGSVKINIQLEQEVIQLNEFVVKAGQSDFDKYYDIFEKLFLGQTPNSKRCTIINPEDINLDYDKETEILKAFATQPIQVENKALGYTIYYLLKEFELDYRSDLYKIFGVPRFETLTPKDDRQLRHWQSNRDDAYSGSLNHFMRSLIHRELSKNQFSIYEQLSGTKKQLDEGRLFLQNGNIVFFKGDMEIIFDGDAEDSSYRTYRNLVQQTSKLTFIGDSITIYENGYYENQKDIVLTGYLAWRECMGNLLPINYQPTEKK